MKDVLTYKEFIGCVHFSTDDSVFFGKIEGINDLVTFEGQTVDEIKDSFKNAVEDYIEMCITLKKPILKSYKGNFNVRIPPELHRKAMRKSQSLGISLNQLVKQAIENEVSEV